MCTHTCHQIFTLGGHFYFEKENFWHILMGSTDNSVWLGFGLQRDERFQRSAAAASGLQTNRHSPTPTMMFPDHLISGAECQSKIQMWGKVRDAPKKNPKERVPSIMSASLKGLHQTWMMVTAHCSPGGGTGGGTKQLSQTWIFSCVPVLGGRFSQEYPGRKRGKAKAKQDEKSSVFFMLEVSDGLKSVVSVCFHHCTWSYTHTITCYTHNLKLHTYTTYPLSLCCIKMRINIGEKIPSSISGVSGSLLSGFVGFQALSKELGSKSLWPG